MQPGWALGAGRHLRSPTAKRGPAWTGLPHALRGSHDPDVFCVMRKGLSGFPCRDWVTWLATVRLCPESLWAPAKARAGRHACIPRLPPTPGQARAKLREVPSQTQIRISNRMLIWRCKMTCDRKKQTSNSTVVDRCRKREFI